ncbi:MAG: hypothetical protein ACM3TR_16585 [Caulobacteraceae bacterium]
MKKAGLIVLTLTLCLILSLGQVWADTDNPAKLILNEGSNIYKLNGK